VSHAAIIAVQRAETLQRLERLGRLDRLNALASGESVGSADPAGQPAPVLLVQDTTSFDFSHHPATTGLGPLENDYMRGFFAHSTLAVSAAGVPLGLVEQQVWVRSADEMGKSEKRRERPFEAKESYKWVRGLPPPPPQSDPGARERGDTGLAYVVVGDAESHIYDFLAVMLDQHLDFIVRAADARSFTEAGEGLFAAVAQQPVQERFTLRLQRHPEREARDADLELRFSPMVLRRPQRAVSKRETLNVMVVDVIEPQPPAGEEAIHWLLLTTLPVEMVAQARQITVWYSYRWLVERLHFVLKSGCTLEASQLRQAERLERLLAVYSAVAWRLLWLTYQARETPEVPCTVALQTAEWQALVAFVQRTRTVPPTPPSLRQAVRWIGQLGGFLGRKRDGEPGVKVLWRGWTRLQDIVQTWSLVHPSTPSPDVGNV
jgi:hypothetical protein